MLEYFKLILQKVSFSKDLFEKELKKALNRLMNQEIATLWSWCNLRFGHKYRVIIDRCFHRYQKHLSF